MKFYLFTAEWCGPCQTMKPTVKDVMESNPDIELVFVDVGDQSNNSLTAKFNVRAVPTLIAYNEDTERVEKSVAGLMNHQQLLDFFKGV